MLKDESQKESDLLFCLNETRQTKLSSIDESKSLLEEGRYIEAAEAIEKIINANTREIHCKWRENRTPQELALFEKARRFEEELFSDLTVQYEEELQAILGKNDVVKKRNPLIIDWIIRIKNKIEYKCWSMIEGYCNIKEKTIYINANHTNDNNLIHEMIHAYENVLSERYKQYIVLRLYQDLSEKLLVKKYNLMNLIRIDTHGVYKPHTLFFMLKSLDLDLQQGNELGTIYGYGREELYKRCPE